MVKIQIELEGSLEHMIKELLECGHYQTKREIIREGIRLVHEKTKRLNGKND